MKLNPKVFLLALVIALVSLGGWAGGLAENMTQTVTLAVFAGVISTTLFFWERRVAAAFLGVAILIATHAMTLQSILKATEASTADSTQSIAVNDTPFMFLRLMID